MPQIGKQGFNPYLHKPIPKNKIARAIQENDSIVDMPARFFGIDNIMV